MERRWDGGVEAPEVTVDASGNRRIKGRTIVVPVVTGTAAFWCVCWFTAACSLVGACACCALRCRAALGALRRRFAHCATPPTSGARLGKKATEYQSHKWTVYMRSPTNEDLQHVIKKVTFVLHESFQVHVGLGRGGSQAAEPSCARAALAPVPCTAPRQGGRQTGRQTDVRPLPPCLPGLLIRPPLPPLGAQNLERDVPYPPYELTEVSGVLR